MRLRGLVTLLSGLALALAVQQAEAGAIRATGKAVAKGSTTAAAATAGGVAAAGKTTGGVAAKTGSAVAHGTKKAAKGVWKAIW